MRFSDELLNGPLETYARVLALERFSGTAKSYVLRRKSGVTLKVVSGQMRSALENKASAEEILAKGRQATSAPNADPERVKQLEELIKNC